MKLRRARILILATLLLLPAAPVPAQQSPSNAGNDMLEIFGSGCSVNGSLTNKTRAQTSSLIQIAEKLRDDEACKGLAPLANDLEKQLNEVGKNVSDQQAALNSQLSQIETLEAAIAAERAKGAQADQTFIQTATKQRQDLQASMAQLTLKQPQLAAQKSAVALQSVQSTAQSLLSRMMSDTCISKKPNLAGQLLGRLIGISSALDPGVYGALSLATGAFIDTLTTTLPKAEFNEAIKAAKNEILYDGIACGYEALAATRCQARDALRALKTRDAQQVGEGCLHPSAMGAGVISRELTTLTSWARQFQMVSSKNNPVALHSFDKLNTLRFKRADLENSFDKAAQKALQGVPQGEAPDDAAMTLYINAMIGELQKHINFNGGGGARAGKNFGTGMGSAPPASSTGDDDENRLPLSKIFIRDPECGPKLFFYSGGKEYARPDDHLLNSNSSCEGYITTRYRDELPPVETIEEAKKILLSQVDELLIPLYKRLQMKDAESVLALGSIPPESGGRSPFEVLSQIDSYLQALDREYQSSDKSSGTVTDRALLTTVSRARSKLEGVMHLVNDPKQSMETIGSALSELINDSPFTSYLSDVVRLDLQRRISRGQDGIASAMLNEIALPGSVADLMRGMRNLESSQISAQNASLRSTENLRNFQNLFGPKVEEILQSLKEKSARNADDRNVLGVHCMRFLSGPSPDLTVLDKYCRGAAYRGAIAGDLAYDKWRDQPFESRACALYDFLRKGELMSKNRGLKVSEERAPPPIQEQEPSSPPSSAAPDTSSGGGWGIWSAMTYFFPK